MLDPEIEETAKLINEAIKDRAQVNLKNKGLINKNSLDRIVSLATILKNGRFPCSENAVSLLREIMRGESPEGAFIGPPSAFSRCGGFFISGANRAKTLVKNFKKRQVFPEGENHFTHPFTLKR